MLVMGINGLPGAGGQEGRGQEGKRQEGKGQEGRGQEGRSPVVRRPLLVSKPRGKEQPWNYQGGQATQAHSPQVQ